MSCKDVGCRASYKLILLSFKSLLRSHRSSLVWTKRTRALQLDRFGFETQVSLFISFSEQQLHFLGIKLYNAYKNTVQWVAHRSCLMNVASNIAFENEQEVVLNFPWISLQILNSSNSRSQSAYYHLLSACCRHPGTFIPFSIFTAPKNTFLMPCSLQ